MNRSHRRFLGVTQGEIVGDFLASVFVSLFWFCAYATKSKHWLGFDRRSSFSLIVNLAVHEGPVFKSMIRCFFIPKYSFGDFLEKKF
jgi:hypothetical protein